MVDVTNITNGQVNGTGYFDKFMDAINAQLASQLTAGRIQQTDFATVYLGALQTALSQAVAYVGVVEQVNASSTRTAAEVALLNQKKLTEESQIKAILSDGTVVFDDATKYGNGAVGKQQTVQQAQADGFLRDAEQKAVKILMDAWSISKSVDNGITTPDGAQNDDIEALIIKLRQGVGITDSIYKFQADAGPDTNIIAGEVTILDGSNSTTPSDAATPVTITSYDWSQVAGAGTTVTITPDPNPLNRGRASFTAPSVSPTASDNLLKFQLKTTGSDGSESYDYVTLTVQNS